MGAPSRALPSAMPPLADQALCIRQWDWSETSQTVLMFGRAQGMVRAIAKGSRRQRAPYSGGIQPLTRGEMLVILKPSTELALLTGWDLQETFPALRRSLHAYYSGMYLAELAQHSLTERDPHPALFDALMTSLRLLGEAAADRLAVLLYQWATLVETGYRPELDIDILSGAPLPSTTTYIFLPALGGFTPDPLTAADGAPPGPRWGVRAATLQFLRRLSDNNPTDLAQASSEDALERAPRLLAHYLREILGRDFPSMSFLFAER
jgi:DNA repair protein RecO (recombination protein O)